MESGSPLRSALHHLHPDPGRSVGEKRLLVWIRACRTPSWAAGPANFTHTGFEWDGQGRTIGRWARCPAWLSRGDPAPWGALGEHALATLGIARAARAAESSAHPHLAREAGRR